MKGLKSVAAVVAIAVVVGKAHAERSDSVGAAAVADWPQNVRDGAREAAGKLAAFVSRHVQAAAVSAAPVTAIHVLPYIAPPGIFPQGFFRITNIGGSDETVELLLIDQDGVLSFDAQIDTRAGETRHVNSEDLAGLGDKWGVRVVDLRVIPTTEDRTYGAFAQTSGNIRIGAFTRSRNGFINDVGSHQLAASSGDGLFQTTLFTANPASNRSTVGVLRYVNLNAEHAEQIDLWAYDERGRFSGRVTCEIPARGALDLNTLQLEEGLHDSCSGMWGDGEGKWQVHSESASLHIAMSFMYSMELGILANVSNADAYLLIP